MCEKKSITWFHSWGQTYPSLIFIIKQIVVLKIDGLALVLKTIIIQPHLQRSQAIVIRIFLEAGAPTAFCFELIVICSV